MKSESFRDDRNRQTPRALQVHLDWSARARLGFIPKSNTVFDFALQFRAFSFVAFCPKLLGGRAPRGGFFTPPGPGEPTKTKKLIFGLN